eukprot:TRINITY_DN701_c0_g2_i2.p1 TRINITY_DN701_c0_g2~~TRINITY_DN701_c0_g2_i2.p1  ORF type:complete len:324 (-),score=61.21 TRINITY_DN701_c0_g2_i2:49-1020(-)
MTELPSVYVFDWQTECELEKCLLAGVATVKTLEAEKFKELPKEISEAVGLLVWHLRGLTAEDFPFMKKLKIISRVGMGYDNIDIEAAGKHSVYVANVPDYGVEEVADSAMCLLLNLLRKTHWLSEGTHRGEWPTMKAVGSKRLRGKNLGIIGLGKIGTAFAQRAKAFGFNIIFYDPYLPDGIDKSQGIHRADTLKQLMETSDIVSVHCYLDATNKHMINKDSLSWLKHGSYLINTARGGLVDVDAVVEALGTGRLAGAALDVLEKEPYLEGSLLNVPNLILTPHTAFYSDDGFHEMRTKATLEVKRVLLGEKPRNCVNKQFLV